MMIPFDEARSKILEEAVPLPPRDVALGEALGLALAADIAAPIDLPPFTNSAMDGFALSSTDAVGDAGLPISQTIKAGDSPRPLERGTCARIMTGAPLPDGADAIVPIEDAVADGDVVRLATPVKKGRHVRYAGEDVARGAIIARAGIRVTARTVALLGALGLECVRVRPSPRVGVVTTGSELVPPGEKLPRGAIYDSNGPAIAAALAGLGIDAAPVRVKDDDAAVTAAIREALETSDILITVGGVSVGDFDHVKGSLEALGARTIFWRAAIKPGKPIFFGTLEKKLIFGLPGNPVSCLITFDQFVRPAILKMMGRRETGRARERARTAEPLTGSDGKTDFLRGICEEENGQLIVRSAGPQGSAMLVSFANSNCLIILPEEISSVEAGGQVEIERYDDSR